MTNSLLEKTSIHPTAVIHPSAIIGEGVVIGPNVVIGENVKIGNGTKIIANAYIEYSEIGENCTISPFATIGSAPQDLGYKGELTKVIIGNDTIIKENVTVHRAAACGDYTTRVGKGPFPTELENETGELIRNKGGEFGTTTGRPRRTGWFDAVIVRHSVRVNGLSKLAINKLDTLSGIGDLKICVAYKKADGTILKDFPAALEELADCEPVYEEFKGFDEDISNCKSFDELPQICKDYILKLEELCECKIAMVGIGPDRSQILER